MVLFLTRRAHVFSCESFDCTDGVVLSNDAAVDAIVLDVFGLDCVEELSCMACSEFDFSPSVASF